MWDSTLFVAYFETTERMQPCYRPLDDPASFSQARTMRSSTFCKLGSDGIFAKQCAQLFRIITSITLNDFGLLQWPAALSRDARDGANQRQQLRDIICVGAGQDGRERDTLLFCNEMMFAAKLTPIYRTRSCFFPANIARTDELSTIALAKSIWPRSRSSASSASCTRCQTPSCCHCTSRRQHAVPEPQPISLGSIFQGMPERSTKIMPVNIARSSMGLRPAYCRLRGARLGRNGSIRLHSLSSISSFGIALHPDKTRQKVNTFRQKLTATSI